MDTLVEIFRYAQRLQIYPYINFKRLLLIPELQNDLVCFITGEPLTEITHKGELLVPQRLYCDWINKIVTHGYDAEIDLKKYKALICAECGLPFVLPLDCANSRCPICSDGDHV
jgi:hypothetical protein